MFVLCTVQTTRESALRASEGRAEKQRKEQDALGLLLTEREAAVLDKEQTLQSVNRWVCVCLNKRFACRLVEAQVCLHAA